MLGFGTGLCCSSRKAIGQQSRAQHPACHVHRPLHATSMQPGQSQHPCLAPAPQAWFSVLTERTGAELGSQGQSSPLWVLVGLRSL